MTQDTETVVVNTFGDIKNAIKSYTKKGNENAREIIIRGIDMLKERHKLYEQHQVELETLDMGGVTPAIMQNPIEARTWLDGIIEKKMGGKRNGLVVRWELQDGTYEWDPISDKLDKC
jgi:hypothetical protein